MHPCIRSIVSYVFFPILCLGVLWLYIHIIKFWSWCLKRCSSKRKKNIEFWRCSFWVFAWVWYPSPIFYIIVLLLWHELLLQSTVCFVWCFNNASIFDSLIPLLIFWFILLLLFILSLILLFLIIIVFLG
jgi:hypothetical protein